MDFNIQSILRGAGLIAEQVPQDNYVTAPGALPMQEKPMAKKSMTKKKSGKNKPMYGKKMTPEQGAENIRKHLLGAGPSTATDSLLDTINRYRQQSLESGQNQIGRTEARIQGLEGKTDGPSLRGLAMIADMFDPGKNYAGQYDAFKKSQGPGVDAQRAALEKQLSAQRGDFIDQAEGFAKGGQALELEKLKQAGQLAYLNQGHKNNRSLAAYKNGLKDSGYTGTGPDLSNLTKGQEHADKAFGKEYQDWVSGGFANVQGNLAKLKGSIDSIANPNTEVGSVIAPEFIRARTNKESVRVEQDVGNVVFQSLKEILGGQFTEKEGQKLVQQTYDPRLSDEDNRAKVQASYDKLTALAEAKQKAVKYFSENGTLKGFQGSDANTIDGFIKEKKKEILDKESGKSRYESLKEKYGY